MSLEKLAVLVHLPRVMPPGTDQACVAHALEYNICTMGSTPEEAISKLVDLVIGHCRMADRLSIRAVNVAEGHLLKAFFLGAPLAYHDSAVEARISQSLDLVLTVRDVRDAQKKLGQYDLEAYVKAAA